MLLNELLNLGEFADYNSALIPSIGKLAQQIIFLQDRALKIKKGTRTDAQRSVRRFIQGQTLG